MKVKMANGNKCLISLIIGDFQSQRTKLHKLLHKEIVRPDLSEFGHWCNAKFNN